MTSKTLQDSAAKLPMGIGTAHRPLHLAETHPYVAGIDEGFGDALDDLPLAIGFAEEDEPGVGSEGAAVEIGNERAFSGALQQGAGRFTVCIRGLVVFPDWIDRSLGRSNLERRDVFMRPGNQQRLCRRSIQL